MLGDGKHNGSLEMKAFDIISMSHGLDLSCMFDSGGMRKERFLTRGRMREVEEKVVRVRWRRVGVQG